MLKTFVVSVLVSASPQSDVSERHTWDVTVEAPTALEAIDRARRGIDTPQRETSRATDLCAVREAREVGQRQPAFQRCDDLIPALMED